MKKIGKKFEPNTSLNAIALFLLAVLIFSCKHEKNQKTPLVRVYDQVLYKEDIPAFIYREKDSVYEVKKYVDKWIRKNVIAHFAMQNVDTAEINRMVNAYRRDLLKEFYENKLKLKLRDQIQISEDELKNYYEQHKKNFPSEKTFIKWEFLILNATDKDRYKIRKLFFSEKPQDREKLEEYFNRFLAYKLDTAGWITHEKAMEIIPPVKKIKLQKGNFTFSEKNRLYLVKILKKVEPGETLPYEVMKDRIKKFVTEQKTRKILKETYNQMLENSYKNKKIKVYNP